MKTLTYFFIFFVLIFSSAFVSSNGCCFYPESGLCTQNTLSDSCTGTFGLNPNCNSLSECDLGCCVLRESTTYSTQRTCYLESLAAGFATPTWQQGVSQSQCSARAGGSNFGACVFNNGYENLCSFVEHSKCSGEFHEGIVCSDSALNTICEKTSKTKCFPDGGVYYIDSCNNRDVLKEMCNYDEGFDCRQKNSREAYCKDLNCVDKWGNVRINGESWCIGLDGEILLDDVRNSEFKKPNEKLPGFNDAVGSRFFKQVCIDGEVVTEPCGDYREEVCIPSVNGSAECVANLGGECAMAMPDPENPSDESWKEDCNTEWCYISRLDDCIQFAGETEVICGERRENWRELPQAQAGTDLAEVSSPLLADLGLVMCLPKISPGSDISSSSFSGEEEGVCSAGNFEKSTWLDHDKGVDRWRIVSSSANDVVVDTTEGRYGNAGIISLDDSAWDIESTSRINWCNLKNNPLNLGQGFSYCHNQGFAAWCCEKSVYLKNKKAIDKAISEESIANPKLIELLDSRTIGLGDCAGDSNWAEGTGSTENLPVSYASRGTSGRDDHILFKFKYESREWRAPASGDCSLCGADGLPCSEYRCNALGKNCEYVEPRGINSGVCVSSNDNSPPTISSSQNPSNPIPPYSSVLIILNTNEDSYCKFDFSSQGGTMEGLRYETDEKFGREHKFSLSVPGRAEGDEDIEEYPLLTRDGQYELFVRCEDAAGNYNINAYIVNLEVMDTPDGVPPEILGFVPSSNSFVKFNTSTKEIRFELNEPADCRWDFQDISYDEMGESDAEGVNSNQFSCDSDISGQTIANGYWCSGTLTNISTNVSIPTKYYIRCKDQPMLEGRENDIYKRNVNGQSEEYVLRASSPLEISDVYPTPGDFIIGGNVPNITYVVKTKNGAERGKAVCRWRYNLGEIRTSWQPFGTTNSSNHEQVLTDLQTANYQIEVFCEDSAGNEAEGKFQLNILVDGSPPELTRVYNNRGNLFIHLSESASCRFITNGGCYKVASNGTLMSSQDNDLSFSANLVKGAPYYIRCEDIFGNSRCFGDIVFY